MNLAGILTESAANDRALDLASARLSALLRERGVGPGDRVGVMLPNVPEFAIACYGILRTGAVVVALDTRLEAKAVGARLWRARARLLIAWHAQEEVADAAAQSAGAECLFVVPGEFERLLRRRPGAGGVRAVR